MKYIVYLFMFHFVLNFLINRANTVNISTNNSSSIQNNLANIINKDECENIIESIGTDQLDTEEPEIIKIWICGIISVSIISLSGVTGVFIYPCLKTKFYQYFMKILIGLAAGCLSATPVLQLIPEAFGLLNNKKVNNKEIINISLLTVLCFWIFYNIEAVCSIASHNNNNKTTANINDGKENNNLLRNNKTDEIESGYKKSKKLKFKNFSSLIWIIIFGDGLHNFIDGLTIGAGYYYNIPTGVSLSISVICEEFPHEIGDLAILINGGMSMKQALMWNFLSGCSCFTGLIIGILLGQISSEKYIFAFAGGMFLYISLVHLIPELKTDLRESLTKHKYLATLSLILQNIGIVMGISAIYFISSSGNMINESIENSMFLKSLGS